MHSELKTINNPVPESQEDSAPQEEIDTQILVPGPRSRTGPNALVHGLYASDIVMPCCCIHMPIILSSDEMLRNAPNKANNRRTDSES
jgi:hypothetical protein